MKSRAADIDHAWLVDRYQELYAISANQELEATRRREMRAYVKGRIDEFCNQNGITPEDRRIAARAAERGAS